MGTFGLLCPHAAKQSERPRACGRGAKCEKEARELCPCFPLLPEAEPLTFAITYPLAMGVAFYGVIR